MTRADASTTPMDRPLDSVGVEGRRVVAVIWQRFGPYHLARLRGASAALAASDWKVVGLEVAEQDHYDWGRAVDAVVERITLFPRCEYDALSARAIRRRTVETLDELQPGAVCINGWAAAEAVAALGWCRAHRRRAILMSETFESSSNPLKAGVRRWRVRQFDGALVGGRLQAAYLASLGYSGQHAQVGYDVVDSHYFSHEAPAFSDQYAELLGRRYFLANTRFLERKGIDALLRAYARYREVAGDEPQWDLVISGSGEMELPWKALAASLGVAPSVHWPGFLAYRDLPSLYQSAGAFVHPARQEPWGLVVNEAAAAGLPLIVGRRVGAACELVRDGENGFLVDPDDTEFFALVLARVACMTKAERDAMGGASRRIVADFGPERFGRALEQCLAMEA